MKPYTMGWPPSARYNWYGRCIQFKLLNSKDNNISSKSQPALTSKFILRRLYAWAARSWSEFADLQITVEFISFYIFVRWNFVGNIERALLLNPWTMNFVIRWFRFNSLVEWANKSGISSMDIFLKCCILVMKRTRMDGLKAYLSASGLSSTSILRSSGFPRLGWGDVTIHFLVCSATRVNSTL